MNEANRPTISRSGEANQSSASINFNDTSSVSSGSSTHSSRDPNKFSSSSNLGATKSPSNNPKRKLISTLLSTNSSSNNNSNSSLCEQSFTGNTSNCSSRNENISSMQRKKLRDPMAHRRVEKTRRDRMNVALIKLGSLIPNSFLKKGLTRVDKIRTVDLAIQYIQHLQGQLGSGKEASAKQWDAQLKHHHHRQQTEHMGSYDDEKNQGTVPGTSSSDTTNASPYSQTSSMLKSLNDSSTNSSLCDNLNYLKGIFDGSVFFVAHLITFMQTKLHSLDDLKITINLYVESLTSFNDAYFSSRKINAHDYDYISKFNCGQFLMDPSENNNSLPGNLQLVKEIVDLLGETRRQSTAKSKSKDLDEGNNGGKSQIDICESSLNRMSSIASNLSVISNHNGSSSSFSSTNSSPPIPSSVCNNVNSNSNNNSNNNDSSPTENNRINDDADCESSYSSNSNSSEAPNQFKVQPNNTYSDKSELATKFPDLIIRKQAQQQQQQSQGENSGERASENAGYGQTSERMMDRMSTNLEESNEFYKHPDLLNLLAKTTALEQHRFYEQRQYNLQTGASVDLSEALPDYHPLRHKHHSQRFSSPPQAQQYHNSSKQQPSNAEMSASMFAGVPVDNKHPKGFPKQSPEASFLEEFEQLKKYKMAELISQQELNNRLSAREHQLMLPNEAAVAAAAAAFNMSEELQKQRALEYRYFAPSVRSASFQELSTPNTSSDKSQATSRMESSNPETNIPEPNRNMLSIFILHSSSEFYVSACLDESLVDARSLNEVLKNLEFKPKSVHKIKLDVVFSPELVINNRAGSAQSSVSSSSAKKTQFARTLTQP